MWHATNNLWGGDDPRIHKNIYLDFVQLVQLRKTFFLEKLRGHTSKVHSRAYKEK